MKRSVPWRLRSPIRVKNKDVRRGHQRSCSPVKGQLYARSQTSATSPPTSPQSEVLPRKPESTQESMNFPKSEPSTSRARRFLPSFGSGTMTGGRLKSLFRRVSTLHGKARHDTESEGDTSQSSTEPSEGHGLQLSLQGLCSSIPEGREEPSLLSPSEQDTTAACQVPSPSAYTKEKSRVHGTFHDIEDARDDSCCDAKLLRTHPQVPRIALVGVFLNGIAVSLASFAPGGGEGAKVLVKEVWLREAYALGLVSGMQRDPCFGGTERCILLLFVGINHGLHSRCSPPGSGWNFVIQRT